MCVKDIGIVIESDNEPAAKALARRVRHMRSHSTTIQESHEHEPQANGIAERCVQATA